MDLLLLRLGFSEIDTFELEPDAPFDPASISDEYPLILIQANGMGGGRLRRSVLSSLGLSLGLDSPDDTGQLRVVGARPLHDAYGRTRGFAANRKGHMTAYFDATVWEAHEDLLRSIRIFQDEQLEFPPTERSRREPACWLVECGGAPDAVMGQLGPAAQELTGTCCAPRPLPNGDAALVIRPHVGDELEQAMRESLGIALYSEEPASLEELVGARLRELGKTVATVESCTAGLVSARLTAIPGSSGYFKAGLTLYSNEAKGFYVEGVAPLVERCGAVSPEVAMALARGAQRQNDVDYAVAITGIAGPDGGTPQKPVGTVFLAAVSRQGDALSHHGLYRGGRESVRYQASQTALHLLRRLLPMG
ncbi:putative competence/damage-inducible protein cinA [Magnetofaba australis IT-1]|uniref:Putative competence/damage-inducible protein cinA n=1 Tax=Magnetofaba australis IT-1 TaxID=1434232 RepID=A0A1Y2K8K4_9PROT|nr:putative competence/damage-inducible protein cinA [Magnetofaba australis IT-1]